jgi:hypothetical protein
MNSLQIRILIGLIAVLFIVIGGLFYLLLIYYNLNVA